MIGEIHSQDTGYPELILTFCGISILIWSMFRIFFLISIQLSVAFGVDSLEADISREEKHLKFA